MVVRSFLSLTKYHAYFGAIAFKRNHPNLFPPKAVKTFDFIYDWRDGTQTKQRRHVLNTHEWIDCTVGDIIDHFSSEEFAPRAYNNKYKARGVPIISFGYAISLDTNSDGSEKVTRVHLELDNFMDETFFTHRSITLRPHNAFVHPYPAVRA